MTAIAGLVHKETVWMGGDSAGADSSFFLQTRKDPKVFVVNGFLIGYTSSFRMGQLLRYGTGRGPTGASLNGIPQYRFKKDPYEYMVKTFMDHIRLIFKSGGYLEEKNGAEEAGTFLVGFQGRLFKVWGDLQVAESLAPYDACGCGRQLVLASLATTQKLSLHPKNRIRTALKIAEQYSAGVRRPFKILQKEWT